MAKDYNFPTDGITASTPKNIMFGACTVHANLTYDNETHQFNGKESVLCATSGGASFKVEPEFLNVEVDGAYVEVAELKQKVGEKVTLEVNAAEIPDKVIEMSAIGEHGDDLPNYNHIKAKDMLESSDYIKNLGIVGTRMDGAPIVIIIPRALCTSGLELKGENKKSATPKITFTGCSTLEDSKRSVGWHIYYPKDIDADGYIRYEQDYASVKDFVYDTGLYTGKSSILRTPKATPLSDSYLIQGWCAKDKTDSTKWSFLNYGEEVDCDTFLTGTLSQKLSFFCSKVRKIIFNTTGADGGLPPHDMELTIGENFCGETGSTVLLDATKKEGTGAPDRADDEWKDAVLKGNPRGLYKNGHKLTGWKDSAGTTWSLTEALATHTKEDTILTPVWNALTMEKGKANGTKRKTSVQNDKDSK